MNCPVCNSKLQVTDRSGVEIDFCPTCRGVWLDRGELDKLIDRASYDSRHDRPERDDRYRNDDERNRPRKREGFLADIFDF